MNRGRLDTAVVERAVAGEQPVMSPAERAEAVRILHDRNWSDRRISQHLGCSHNTVSRLRGQLGLVAVPAGAQERAVSSATASRVDHGTTERGPLPPTALVPVPGVYLPQATYARLVHAARRHGTTVPELLAVVVREALRPHAAEHQKEI